jgi:hypothetical protein
MGVKYIAYIDESGDPGLSSLKPTDPSGSSEWLIVSCFLVREENDHKCVGWVREILSKFRNVQTPYLHFNELLPVKKKIACEMLAKKPCRLFVVMSNKKNIVRHSNPNIRDGNKNWLYWWLMRLLLERVTDYCEQATRPEQRGTDYMRIVFSRRGGMKYIDFARYIEKLRCQSRVNKLYLDTGDLCWSMVNDEEIFALSHKERAGLQLADIVAGAFFQAVERDRPADCDPECALILKPRMALSKHGNILGYSIKTMPPDLDKMALAPNQRLLFEGYGYNKEGW